MIVAHLRSSSFFGGPEQQILGLSRSLSAPYESLFLLFVENGQYEPFRDRIARHGFRSIVLERNLPHLRAMVRELADVLHRESVRLLCSHGYKADLVGWLAARRVGIPVVAVAHGWTAQNRKVRFYETLDRLAMRRMDRVVCVSEGQAVKVRRAGVSANRVRVIRNAIRVEEYQDADPSYRDQLRGLFSFAPTHIVGAAGRLSPEKGFRVLVAAAAIVARTHPDVGFVVFGDGVLRDELARQIQNEGIERQFILAGFRTDVTRFFPFLDVNVLPSFTEGLPIVALEAYASGVPVVATAVGGNPEVVADGVDGYLVPAGDPAALARRILDVLADDDGRRRMGERGRQRIVEHFSVSSQEAAYRQVFDELLGSQTSRPVERRAPDSVGT